MVTCYPKYNINLGDKDFDNSLSLYFKFLKNNFMKEGNNIITMNYIVLYTLSNSNYGRIYQDKPFIEICDECREIVEIIEPQKLDRIEIPTNYILSLEDRDTPNHGGLFFFLATGQVCHIVQVCHAHVPKAVARMQFVARPRRYVMHPRPLVARAMRRSCSLLRAYACPALSRPKVSCRDRNSP